jgi:hypothetical protein
MMSREEGEAQIWAQIIPSLALSNTRAKDLEMFFFFFFLFFTHEQKLPPAAKLPSRVLLK